MKIAIDIDDTIYKISHQIDKLTRKYIKINKIKVIIHKDRYKIDDRYEGLILDNKYFEFMRTHTKYLYLRRMNNRIRKCLLQLSRDNTLYFITNRDNNWINSAESITYSWLMKYLNRNKDNIFLYAGIKDKGRLCRLLNCNVLIDNDINVLIKAEGLVKYRIKITLPNAIDESFFYSELHYVNNWKAVIEMINLLKGELDESY